MGRLRELSDADRAILDAASVQGFEFDGALVARMLRRDALEILQALAGLARRHGVVRSRGALFTFDHHLLHELVHGQIPLALRTEYHAALAKAYADARSLSGRSPDDIPGEDSVFMATHLLMGGRMQEGADYVLAAFDHLASSAQIGSVLDLAKLASERSGSAQGIPPPAFDALRKARWHAHLGDAHWTSGRFPEAEAFLESALADLGVRVPRSDLPRKLFIVRQALVAAVAPVPAAGARAGVGEPAHRAARGRPHGRIDGDDAGLSQPAARHPALRAAVGEPRRASGHRFGVLARPAGLHGIEPAASRAGAPLFRPRAHRRALTAAIGAS